MAVALHLLPPSRLQPRGRFVGVRGGWRGNAAGRSLDANQKRDALKTLARPSRWCSRDLSGRTTRRRRGGSRQVRFLAGHCNQGRGLRAVTTSSTSPLLAREGSRWSASRSNGRARPTRGEITGRRLGSRQVGDQGEDPPVVVAGGEQAELVKDMNEYTRSPREHHSRARKPSDASVSSPGGDRGHQRVPGSHLGSTGATVGGLAAENDGIAEHLLVHIACRYPRTPHLLRAGFPSRARPPHRHHGTNCACLLRRRGMARRTPGDLEARGASP